MRNNASFPGGRRDIGFSGQELFYIDEESFGNIICFFILFEMSYSVLISILPSKILGVAAKDIQTLVVCEYSFNHYQLKGQCCSLNMFFKQQVTVITTVHMFHISVTESGLGYYGLQPFGPGSGFESIVTGTFAGLAILGPDSEFPVVLTTSKTDQCCFLEMRGTLYSYS